MSSDEVTKSWPSVLTQKLNNPNVEIVNLGMGGACMSKHGTSPYWLFNEYKIALNSDPDYIIMMLGTNDANP